MTLRLMWKLVINNFKSIRMMVVPFILSLSFIFGLHFILLSISMNDYFHREAEMITTFAIVAQFILFLLSVSFALYANQFMMHHRKKNFALSMMFGMEKKHLCFLLLIENIIEFVIIAVISVIGGFLFSLLMFMFLNKVLQRHHHVTLADFTLNMNVVWLTLLILILVMGLIFLVNIVKVTLQNPIQLVQKENNQSQRIKKVRLIILLVLGLVLLGSGYYLALTTQGIFHSLLTIFEAMLLVFVGTYCLFMSLSLFTLKGLQRIPRVYYHPVLFFSINGMISRMKTDAISLANMSVICTFLIATIGLTIMTYQGAPNLVKTLTDQRDYTTVITVENEKNKSLKAKTEKVLDDVQKYATISQLKQRYFVILGIDIKDNNVFDVAHNDQKATVQFTPEKEYNRVFNKNLKLAPNELGITENSNKLGKQKSIQIGDQMYSRVDLKDTRAMIRSTMESDIFVVVPDEQQLDQILHTLLPADKNLQNYKRVDLAFNVDEGKHALEQHSMDILKKDHVQLTNTKEMSRLVYQLDSGLIFLGVIISAALITILFLILYYKQMVEADEDQKRYALLSQLGVEGTTIRKVINQQLRWLFTLPALVAIIHTLVATKIIYKIISVLGVQNMWQFALVYFGVLVIVVVCYGLLCIGVSTIYYNIVYRGLKRPHE